MNNYMPIKWTAYKKMDRFLERYSLPKLNQEEILKNIWTVELPLVKVNQ